LQLSTVTTHDGASERKVWMITTIFDGDEGDNGCVDVELLALTLHGSDWLQVSLNHHQQSHQRTARIALEFKVSHA